MHKPFECEFVAEIGLTGKARGRRQWFTGKSIMQVEVVQEVKTVVGTQVTGRRYKTIWRDATLSESFQIQHRVGLMVKPDDETHEVKRPAPPTPPSRPHTLNEKVKEPPC